MTAPFLLAKLHRATVTGADLHYEGSVAIDPTLLRAAGIRPLQLLEIYDIDNGARFSTYAIAGEPGQITLNGAAARLVHPGDRVILCAYGQLTPDEAAVHEATVVLVGEGNAIEQVLRQRAALP